MMKSKGANRLALVSSFLALGLLALLWWAIHSWYREKLLTEQRAHVAGELAPYGNTLSGAISRRLGILKGLKAFVEPHLSEPTFATELERFAAGLYAATTGVRVLTVAPGGIPRYVYPLSGNESVIGHDPMRDPRPGVRADVERAVQSREITLSGPDELRPGGSGLVARLAVYKDQIFWGFVTVALDLQPILEATGLNQGPAGLKLALRSRGGRAFFGDSTVFEHEPVIYRVELPEGYWELAAMPPDGWNASIHEPLAILNGAALLLVLPLTMLVYLGVDREVRLTFEVKERTEEIHRAKGELERDIAERKRIEEELRKAHDELEERVSQRTIALRKTNEALDAEVGERKRAAEALRESELKFHGIFNQTFQFVGLLNPDGTLLEANQPALDFIGCELSDVVGRPFWETPWWDVSPDVRNRVKNAIAEAAKGNFVRYETEHRRSDGSVSTFDFSLKPVSGETGKVVLIIPEGRDVTDRKRAQEELRRARDELEIRVQERTQELARTNEELRAEIAERQRLQEQLVENGRLAAIGATAAKFAHEVGNPLNGMFLTAQRLERHLAGQPCYSDQAVQSTLRRLRDEISRLTHLLNEFRSLSRREQYNFQPTSLAMVAGEIFAMEAENYAAGGILVEQDFPADLPLVQADRDKLKQALWNLCKNSVEAMPQGGTLTLNAYSSGADVVLEIGDTGVGIPSGVDIFEPFTTTKSSGSGLGLVVVRQIVAAHGGNLTYTSEPGKGTAFRLTLPQAALQYAAV